MLVARYNSDAYYSMNVPEKRVAGTLGAYPSAR